MLNPKLESLQAGPEHYLLAFSNVFPAIKTEVQIITVIWVLDFAGVLLGLGVNDINSLKLRLHPGLVIRSLVPAETK